MKKLHNIVLIGMPGSGKSTIGKKLSKSLRMPFLDTDSLVEKSLSMTISDIFSQHGEPFFRDIETKCVKNVSLMQNTIISTGGGVILREENMESLINNGLVIFLDRNPHEIIKSANLKGRPLLTGEKDKFFALYNERIQLYKKFAMYTVKDVKSVKQALLRIINYYKKMQ